MKRIELALRQCSQAPSVASATNLLALLPGEVSDVITCLSREAFESYDEVKEALLRRYKLSPEAFRQRFRYAKRGNESHVDFAFRLKADLVEWLKGEDVYDDRDKVVECIALEQFYRCIEDDVKLWLQDKLGEVQLNKAAELAEEYYTRRNLHSRAVRVEKAERKEGFPRKPDERKPFPNRNLRKDPIAYMALTRSQARKLSQELDLVPCSKTSPPKAAELRDLGCESTAPRTEDSRAGLLEQPVARAVSVVSVGGESEVAPLGETGTTLSPQPTAGPDWRLQLADARGPKRGYKRSKPRSDERERLKKSRVVIAPQCEPNKLSAPVPKM
ncbi:hypothetical protein HPB50_024652 [Hyalomma asiaticum]|uniref:Uncharacterized protein n=1 Tax=Hyalomma asiaticum TaxID=266040 RepID=A0ACB7T3X8_HYAAI|nr:hypothetical protein HPB50_024652 [Hyalomma asiaticum]